MLKKKVNTILVIIVLTVLVVSALVCVSRPIQNSGDVLLDADRNSNKSTSLDQISRVVTVDYIVEGFHERRRGDYLCKIFSKNDSWTDLVRVSAPQRGFPSRYTYSVGVSRGQALALKSCFPAGSVLKIHASSDTRCEGSLILTTLLEESKKHEVPPID